MGRVNAEKFDVINLVFKDYVYGIDVANKQKILCTLHVKYSLIQINSSINKNPVSTYTLYTRDILHRYRLCNIIPL